MDILPLLAVDCDDCILQMSRLWHRELELQTKKGLNYDDIKHSYDLTPYYKEELQERHFDGFEFWRKSNLYDDLSPLVGAVETLKKASEKFEVVFVSQPKGFHHKSKVYFLKKWFPFTEGILLTKEKYYVPAVVYVDDNPKHFEQMAFRYNTVNVLKQTDATDIVDNTFTDMTIKCWEKDGDWLLGEIEKYAQ